MSWHYSGNPAASDRDAVRWHSGDVNEDEQLITDEEIEYALSESRDVNGAVVLCAESIAAQLTREADMKVGQLSVSLSHKAEHFWELAKKFRTKSLVYAIPSVGGISISEKETQDEDDDRVKPRFERGQFKGRHGSNEAEIAPDRSDWE